MTNQNNIIILEANPSNMGNQYSITVSDETEIILKTAKEHGYKVSQLVDVAVKTLGLDAMLRLQTVYRQANAHLNSLPSGDQCRRDG